MKTVKALFDTAMSEVLLRKPSKFEITEVVFSGIYHHKVSNSHSAPKGKPTNWYRDSEKPLYYRGISGRLNISYTNRSQKHYWVSDILELGLIHIGTGGSREYDFRIYYDDYPDLMEPLEKQLKHEQLLHKMKGHNTNPSDVLVEYHYINNVEVS